MAREADSSDPDGPAAVAALDEPVLGDFDSDKRVAAVGAGEGGHRRHAMDSFVNLDSALVRS